MKEFSRLPSAASSFSPVGPVAFNSEGVSAGKDWLNMAHVCKVDSTKETAEAGVEFWEMQMDFRPEGVTLHSVNKSTDL